MRLADKIGFFDFAPRSPWRFWIKRKYRTKSTEIRLAFKTKNDYFIVLRGSSSYLSFCGQGSVIMFDQNEFVVMRVEQAGYLVQDYLYCARYASSKDKLRVHALVMLGRIFVLAFPVLLLVMLAMISIEFLTDLLLVDD